MNSTSHAKKILVIRFSSLGDVALVGPILASMKQQSGLEVHLLTKQNMGDLLQGGNGVDRFYTWGEQDLWKKLKAEKYDGILDLHRNFRSVCVLIQLLYLNFNHTYSQDWPAASYSKKRFIRWLFVKTKRPRFQVSHVQDRYAEAAKSLLYDLDPTMATRFVEGLSWMNHGLGVGQLSEKELGELPKQYGVAILGGTYPTKKITESVWDHVFEGSELTWVLLGASGELALSQRLSDRWGERVVNKVGSYSLSMSSRCIAGATMVVGGDTGFTHVAAAFGRPLLVIWGNTHPGLGFAPGMGLIQPQTHENEIDNKRPPVIQLYAKNLSCHPCSKLGFEACPKGHFRCMQDYSAQEIKLMLQKLQANSLGGR